MSLVSANFKARFVRFGSDMGMDFSLDEAGGLLAEIVEKGIQVRFGALGFEHDGAVWFVADPAGDREAFGA